MGFGWKLGSSTFKAASLDNLSAYRPLCPQVTVEGILLPKTIVRMRCNRSSCCWPPDLRCLSLPSSSVPGKTHRHPWPPPHTVDFETNIADWVKWQGDRENQKFFSRDRVGIWMLCFLPSFSTDKLWTYWRVFHLCLNLHLLPSVQADLRFPLLA